MKISQVNNKNDIKEMLFYLAIGLEKWKENPRVIPNSFYIGLLKIMKLMSVKNEIVPNNFYQLFHYLKSPFKTWSINGLDKLVPLDQYFLEADLQLSESIVDFLQSYKVPFDSDIAFFYDFQNDCCNNNLITLHRDVLLFIFDNENAVISKSSLDLIVKQMFTDEYAIRTIKECYELIEAPLKYYKKCSNCGWALKEKNGQQLCKNHSVCANFPNYKVNEFLVIEESERYVRLKPLIHKLIVIPNLQTIRLYNRLFNYERVLHPKINEIFITVKVANEELKLHIKNFSSPVMLAKYFNEFDENEFKELFLRSNSFIVIPDIRIRPKKRYMQLLKQNLCNHKNNVLELKIISETELMNYINSSSVNTI